MAGIESQILIICRCRIMESRRERAWWFAALEPLACARGFLGVGFLQVRGEWRSVLRTRRPWPRRQEAPSASEGMRGGVVSGRGGSPRWNPSLALGAFWGARGFLGVGFLQVRGEWRSVLRTRRPWPHRQEAPSASEGMRGGVVSGRGDSLRWNPSLALGAFGSWVFAGPGCTEIVLRIRRPWPHRQEAPGASEGIQGCVVSGRSGSPRWNPSLALGAFWEPGFCRSGVNGDPCCASGDRGPAARKPRARARGYRVVS